MFASKPPFHEVLEFFMLYDWNKKSCENALNSSAIDKVLKENEKYDLVLLETFNSDCMLGVAHKLKAPVIGLASCALMPWQYDRIGNPHNPSYIPALFVGYSEKMSYKQRMYNYFMVHGLQALYSYFTNSFTNKQLRERFGNDMPDIEELAKKTSLIFVNQHFSLSGAVPLAKTVIEIGGIHIQQPKKIEKVSQI
jgi:glucuronosyltransferase